MFKLQQKVGIVIVAFSVWTAIGNAMNYHDFFDLLSIIFALVSLALFAVSIFVDRNWMRVAQVVCIAAVAIFSITSEPEKTLDVASGCFFMLVSIALAFAYDFFDRYPAVVVIAAIFSLTVSFSISTGSMVTGAGIGFGVTAGCAVIWAIVYDKVRRLRQAVKKMAALGDRMDEALLERKDHGKI